MLSANTAPLLPPVVMGLNAVIMAVTDETPRVLTVKYRDHAQTAPAESASPTVGTDLPDALPFGH